MASIWDAYPDLTSAELRTLVTLSAQVLAESSPDVGAVREDVLDMPTRALAKELADSLGEDADREHVQSVLEDEESSRRLSLAVLDQIRRYPALAKEVADAYEERADKMAGPETLLLAAALVLIAIRIKEIRVGKSGTEITFSESAEAVKVFLSGLLATFKG